MGVKVKRGNPIILTNTREVDIEAFDRLKDAYLQVCSGDVNNVSVVMDNEHLCITVNDKSIRRSYVPDAGVDWVIKTLYGCDKTLGLHLETKKVSKVTIPISERSALDAIKKKVRAGAYVYVENDTLNVVLDGVFTGRNNFSASGADFQKAIITLEEQTKRTRETFENLEKLKALIKANNLNIRK